jgi:hypothetical protein
MSTIDVLNPTYAPAAGARPITPRTGIPTGGRIAYCNNGKPHAEDLLIEIRSTLSREYGLEETAFLDMKLHTSDDVGDDGLFDDAVFRDVVATGAQGIVVAVGD